MNQRQKQGAIIAAFTLLAFGTAFMFTGKKDDPGEPDEPDDGPPGPDDPPPCPIGQVRGPDGICRGAGIIDDFDPAEPPSGDLDDFLNVVPQGDHFYAVKYGDTFLGTKTSTSAGQGHDIAWMLYQRECWEAAKQYGGLDDADAWAWVNTISKSMNQSGQVYKILLCSAFNDACYATWGYCGPKGVASGRCAKVYDHNPPGPQGRTIQLLKKHPNQFVRIKQGKNVARFCTIGSPANAGDGTAKNASGMKGYYPQLWCPKLDRQLLWDTHGAEIEITPETWEDGSSRSVPPPWIMKGDVVLDFSGTLSLPGAFGCAPGNIEIGGVPKQSSGVSRG